MSAHQEHGIEETQDQERISSESNESHDEKSRNSKGREYRRGNYTTRVRKSHQEKAADRAAN
jgi:hypothetical protein